LTNTVEEGDKPVVKVDAEIESGYAFKDLGFEGVFIPNAVGDPLLSIVGFWFAWYAFHPETQIFQTK